MAFTPLFEQLGLTGLQAASLASLSQSGLSNANIISTLRSAGLTFNQNNAGAFLSYLKGANNAASLYKNALAAGNQLDQSYLSVSPYNQKANYNYFFKITVYNSDTDETYEIERQMGTRNYMSDQDAIDDFVRGYFNRPDKYPEEFISAQTVQVLRKQ